MISSGPGWGSDYTLVLSLAPNGTVYLSPHDQKKERKKGKKKKKKKLLSTQEYSGAGITGLTAQS